MRPGRLQILPAALRKGVAAGSFTADDLPVLASVVSFTWNDTAHSSRWVFGVAFTARDQVNVAMKDGLPGDFTIVRPNIESFDTSIYLLESSLFLL